jgi:hypothetical protein
MWTLAYGITRSKLTHGMSQHGRPLCRHSLGAGTERRERIYAAKVAGFCPTCGLRRVPAALSACPAFEIGVEERKVRRLAGARPQADLDRRPHHPRQDIQARQPLFDHLVGGEQDRGWNYNSNGWRFSYSAQTRNVLAVPRANWQVRLGPDNESDQSPILCSFDFSARSSPPRQLPKPVKGVCNIQAKTTPK